MDRLHVLAPIVALVALFVGGFAIYCVLCALGRAPELKNRGRKYNNAVGPFIIRYLLWFISPAERFFINNKVSPNGLTICSILACAVAGVAIATSHLTTAAWLYIFAGLLDVLDGRLARATNQQSRAGGFLDSVADRWGELFVFTGFAWFLRDSAWLLAVMFAVAGSIMVSYTRARGEGYGLNLKSGAMQRAERILLVSVGTLITAWFDSANDTAQIAPHVIGTALLIVGFASSATAIGRWVHGYRELKELDAAAAGDSQKARKRREDEGARAEI